jgi:hypothetical protein
MFTARSSLSRRRRGVATQQPAASILPSKLKRLPMPEGNPGKGRRNGPAKMRATGAEAVGFGVSVGLKV